MIEIDPVVLLESLEESVDSTIFDRGLRYHHSGRVTSVKFLDDPYSHKNPNYVRVSGVVSGSRTYKTVLGLDDSTVLDYECSCPYDMSDEPCKHIIALGITLADCIGQGKLTTHKIRGQVPLPPRLKWEGMSLWVN